VRLLGALEAATIGPSLVLEHWLPQRPARAPSRLLAVLYLLDKLSSMRTGSWTDWVEWARTTLRPEERATLWTALTSQQQERLHTGGHVWAKELGVLWNDPSGNLRRARYTHGMHFETARGRFYIDSEGNALAS
jgi:hypothetical protein